MKNPLPIILLSLFSIGSFGQTLFVPGGIGSNITNSNVGVGTATPQSKLDVSGNIQISNASIPMGLMTEVGGTTPLLNFSLNFREPNFNTSYIGAGFRIDSRSTTDFPLFQWLVRSAGSSAENTAMCLTQDGKLGVGINFHPTAPLHVMTGSTNPMTIFESVGSTNSWITVKNSVAQLNAGIGSTGSTIGFSYLWSSSGKFMIGSDGNPTVVVDGMGNGNVGIGTTTPGSSYKLDVNGTINAAGILINGAPFAGGGSQWTTSGSNVYYNTSGNVGIGTATPNFKLELAADTQLAIGKTYLDNCLDANNSYVRSNFGSNVFWDGVNHVWQVRQIGNNDFSSMIHPNSDGLAFITAPSDGNVAKSLTNSQFMAYERMRITASGNVGIGTTSPDAKLTVTGQVHAQEVKVTVSAPGPDYVFEKDYKLTSLEEIKNYIDQNKHLPEVPSAKEMEKNGIQLGEMNILLLKKIEELTLYVIEQNKKMEILSEKVKTLETNK